jgi:threonine 3-dehydrogenase
LGFDVNEFRINMAKKYADVVINGAKEPALDIVRKISRAHGGADVIVESTAAPSVYETMFQMARPEAHIIIIGLPDEVLFNVAKYLGSKSLNIKGHYRRKLWSTWDKLNPSFDLNLINTC